MFLGAVLLEANVSGPVVTQFVCRDKLKSVDRCELLCISDICKIYVLPCKSGTTEYYVWSPSHLYQLLLSERCHYVHPFVAVDVFHVLGVNIDQFEPF